MKLPVINTLIRSTFEYINLSAMAKKSEVQTHSECSREFMVIKDAMEILGGKWKIRIIATLTMREQPLRFMELIRMVDGIGAKMLSRELQDLEINLLVKRTVLDTKPITVEYELTPHGRTLKKAIDEIHRWGVLHRRKITGRMKGL